MSNDSHKKIYLFMPTLMRPENPCSIPQLHGPRGSSSLRVFACMCETKYTLAVSVTQLNCFVGSQPSRSLPDDNRLAVE